MMCPVIVIGSSIFGSMEAQGIDLKTPIINVTSNVGTEVLI